MLVMYLFHRKLISIAEIKFKWIDVHSTAVEWYLLPYSDTILLLGTSIKAQVVTANLLVENMRQILRVIKDRFW